MAFDALSFHERTVIFITATWGKIGWSGTVASAVILALLVAWVAIIRVTGVTTIGAAGQGTLAMGAVVRTTARIR